MLKTVVEIKQDTTYTAERHRLKLREAHELKRGDIVGDVKDMGAIGLVNVLDQLTDQDLLNMGFNQGDFAGIRQQFEQNKAEQVANQQVSAIGGFVPNLYIDPAHVFAERALDNP